jgi:hypothetical protein
MKKRIIILAGSLLLLAGCKSDDGVVTVKEGSAKKTAGPTGDALWASACNHAIDLMRKSDEMRDVPRDQLDKALAGAVKDCRAEFAQFGGADADEAARCVLKLDRFDPKTFAECEPKKRKSKEEQ